ncbi:MAG: hypothetical protein WD232_04745, partial [Acidimicrobiales bacterium]
QALFEVLGSGAADLAIELHVPTEVVLPRLAARRICSRCDAATTAAPGAPPEQPCDACGGTLERRSDDTDEAIANRLALYDSQTGPLLVWLDSIGVLTTIDGTGSADIVARRMMTAVAERAPALLEPQVRSGLADAG